MNASTLVQEISRAVAKYGPIPVMIRQDYDPGCKPVGKVEVITPDASNFLVSYGCEPGRPVLLIEVLSDNND